MDPKSMIKKLRKSTALQRVLLFIFTFAYWEFLLHMFIFAEFKGLLFPLMIAVTMGIFAGLLTTSCRPRMNLILTWVILLIRFLFIMVYLIFWKVFKTAFSFALILGGSEGVNALTQFSNLVINALKANVFAIILFILPLIVFLIYTIRHPRYKYLRAGSSLKFATAAVILMAAFNTLLAGSGEGTYDAKNLYSGQWVKDLSIRKLGFDLTAFQDLKFTLLPGLVPQEGFTAYTMPTIEAPADKLTNIVDVVIAYPDLDSEEAVSLFYEDNTLDIDFAALAEKEEDDDLKWLDEYMAAATPTKQNKYTGMFEGYNLIYMTAESLSPWAVDKDLTPTLYKMVNEGFVLNNFYIPAFNNTSDGEYMVCTGLIPNGQGNHSFQDSETNDMAQCFGKVLGSMGYSTYAYHPHTYTYYERDKTHPNMGYTYKGRGNGLEVDGYWPESDLQMIQASIDDYIDDEHFHAYYMTVSGHMDYTFHDNYQSYVHYDEVADLDCDEQMQAYIACNIELDRALEYLIQRLEEKGIADKTLIAFGPDHYPYAMEDLLTGMIGDEATKWYGLYESTGVIWSASMTSPVKVDKVCSTIDLAPTICNLLGLQYDSRLYGGQDILSEAAGLVIFANKSFVTDYVIYDTVTGEYKLRNPNVTLPDGYIDAMIEIVNNKWKASGRILTSDYYRYLKEKLGWDRTIFPPVSKPGTGTDGASGGGNDVGTGSETESGSIETTETESERIESTETSTEIESQPADGGYSDEENADEYADEEENGDYSDEEEEEDADW